MYLKLLCLFLFVSANCYGAFTEGDAGTSAAQFLKLGSGARNSAMGDTGAAITEGPGGIYWNPAGLAYSEKRSLSVMHAVWFGGIGYSWLGYAQPLKKGGGVLGFGLQYLNYGSIQGTEDITGAPTADFNPNDLAASVVYSVKTGKDLSLGIGAKYIRSRIEAAGQTFAGDAGLLYRPSRSPLSFGLTVQNVGGRIKYDDRQEKLPLGIRAGVGYAAAKGLLLAADAASYNDTGILLGAGGEYKFAMTDNIALTGRAGYHTGNKDTGGGLTGLTMGAGISYKAYALDYAFVPFGALGNTYRVSLDMKF